jgi:hypothetical protein
VTCDRCHRQDDALSAAEADSRGRPARPGILASCLSDSITSWLTLTTCPR